MLESRLDKGCGPIASILVQQGQLKVYDNIIAGTNYGRVRSMKNEDGKVLKVAGPSTPVVILGLNGAKCR